MYENDYFEGFDETQYEEETRERWGHTSNIKNHSKNGPATARIKKRRSKRKGGGSLSGWSLKILSPDRMIRMCKRL